MNPDTIAFVLVLMSDGVLQTLGWLWLLTVACLFVWLAGAALKSVGRSRDPKRPLTNGRKHRGWE